MRIATLSQTAPQLRTQAPASEPAPEGTRDSFRRAVTTGAFASGGATVGYLAGAGAGSALNNIGASARYLTYGPVMGAALGASWGLLAYTEKDDAMTRFVRGAATLGTGASLGTVAGDALGIALASLTGKPSYTAFGALAGGASGALTALAIERKDRQDMPSRIVKGAAATVGAATSGWFLGGGVGALISHLTNQATVFGLAPALGAVTGGLLGCAAYIIRTEKAEGDA